MCVYYFGKGTMSFLFILFTIYIQSSVPYHINDIYIYEIFSIIDMIFTFLIAAVVIIILRSYACEINLILLRPSASQFRE